MTIRANMESQGTRKLGLRARDIVATVTMSGLVTAPVKEEFLENTAAEKNAETPAAVTQQQQPLQASEPIAANRPATVQQQQQQQQPVQTTVMARPATPALAQPVTPLYAVLEPASPPAPQRKVKSEGTNSSGGLFGGDIMKNPFILSMLLKQGGDDDDNDGSMNALLPLMLAQGGNGNGDSDALKNMLPIMLMGGKAAPTRKRRRHHRRGGKGKHIKYLPRAERKRDVQVGREGNRGVLVKPEHGKRHGVRRHG